MATSLMCQTPKFGKWAKYSAILENHIPTFFTSLLQTPS